MAETGQVFVDSATVTTVGTPAFITTRDVTCNSVYLLPKSSNTGDVLLVDFTDPTTKNILIPKAGMTLPISNPALIKIDVTVNGEGLDWVAV